MDYIRNYLSSFARNMHGERALCTKLNECYYYHLKSTCFYHRQFISVSWLFSWKRVRTAPKIPHLTGRPRHWNSMEYSIPVQSSSPTIHWSSGCISANKNVLISIHNFRLWTPAFLPSHLTLQLNHSVEHSAFPMLILILWMAKITELML